jgi:hypothetical protein
MRDCTASVFPSTFGILGQGGIKGCFEVGGSRGSRGHGVMLGVVNGKRKVKTRGGYLARSGTVLLHIHGAVQPVTSLTAGNMSSWENGAAPRYPKSDSFPAGSRTRKHDNDMRSCPSLYHHYFMSCCMGSDVGFTRGDESANNAFIEGPKHALLPCVSLLLSTVSEEITRKKLFYSCPLHARIRRARFFFAPTVMAEAFGYSR